MVRTWYAIEHNRCWVCRVLVVEDEYFLADDLTSELEPHGAEVIGPVHNLSDARALIERDGFDVAIVDIELHNEMAFILGDALARQNIPFLFATGYRRKLSRPGLNMSSVGRSLTVCGNCWKTSGGFAYASGPRPARPPDCPVHWNVPLLAHRVDSGRPRLGLLFEG